MNTLSKARGGGGGGQAAKMRPPPRQSRAVLDDDGDDAAAAAAAAPWKLYFAYGSNLSQTQMSARCPGSIAVGLAVLRGWSWVINKRGYANIMPAEALAGELGGGGGENRQDEEQRQRALLGRRLGPTVGDEAVYGVLYRLPPADERALDLCEGVPWAYQKMSIPVEVVFPSRAEAAAALALAGSDAGYVTAGDGAAVDGAAVEGGDGNNGNSNSAGSVPTDDDPNATNSGDGGAGSADGTGAASAGGLGRRKKRALAVEALIYVDRTNLMPSRPRDEYVARMNRGIAEAQEVWGLPSSYADKVMRPFIPERAW